MKLLGFFQVMFMYVNQSTVIFHTHGNDMGMNEGLLRMLLFHHAALCSFVFPFHSLPTNTKKHAYINVVKGAANSRNTIENWPRNIIEDSYSCSE
jgi:hypothetical protein